MSSWKTDNPVIRQEGVDVIGTEYGGWIVMYPRRRYDERGDFISMTPFMAAFSDFDDLLTWLKQQPRHDNMPSPASPPEKS